jgi:energy-coupling factor transporter transmembrane protein EcfT
MDYEKPSKELKNLFIILFIIFILQLIFFLNKIYCGGLFVLFLLMCWFFFNFMNNKSKKEELNTFLKIRKNKTRYLFKEFPKEFP